MREDRIYLLHIRDAITQILEYVHEGRQSFMLDSKTQDAVIRKLEIVGEATKNISPELKTQHPQIPWRSMAGMRDKLIHEYFGVDTTLVWETVEYQLPDIAKRIEKMIVQLK